MKAIWKVTIGLDEFERINYNSDKVYHGLQDRPCPKFIAAMKFKVYYKNERGRKIYGSPDIVELPMQNSYSETDHEDEKEEIHSEDYRFTTEEDMSSQDRKFQPWIASDNEKCCKTCLFTHTNGSSKIDLSKQVFEFTFELPVDPNIFCTFK